MNKNLRELEEKMFACIYGEEELERINKLIEEEEKALSRSCDEISEQ